MGILRALRSDAEPRVAPTIESRHGARARIVEHEGGERLEVIDPEGRLVFEYDPASGRSTLSVPDGDLALRAPHGRIDLAAAEGVRCQTVGPVELESATAVSLSATGESGRSAGLLLGGEAARVKAPHIGLRADRATASIDDFRYRGQKLHARLDTALLALDRVETVAKSILEKAVNVYRQVTELHQLRAGRTRTHVEGAHLVQADSSEHRTRGPVRIDGERIELG
ncbi:MAG: DUF3540 domain-containing protein [Myxococcota bacterium]